MASTLATANTLQATTTTTTNFKTGETASPQGSNAQQSSAASASASIAAIEQHPGEEAIVDETPVNVAIEQAELTSDPKQSQDDARLKVRKQLRQGSLHEDDVGLREVIGMRRWAERRFS